MKTDFVDGNSVFYPFKEHGFLITVTKDGVVWSGSAAILEPRDARDCRQFALALVEAANLYEEMTMKPSKPLTRVAS